ncbi:MAG: tRNA threonylcarbamoyladenosine dehydratase [Deltaproteobacteria bacterium]|nr:tRNA threonylcarbamoyladenosine dehydratase [Deltaproteobacteria bacterium]
MSDPERTPLAAPPAAPPHPGRDLPEGHHERFGGLARLYGAPALQRLWGAHACVVGVGGVGAWAVEALARSGVGRLTLIDLDDVCVTNTNRQLHTLAHTVGRLKVEVMAERARQISPHAAVHEERAFFTARTCEALLAPAGRPPYDVVIDAIDSTEHKALLIAECWRRGVPAVVSGGAGGRRAAHALTCGDLSAATHDGLLRQVRRLLRAEHGLPEGPWGVTAVYSRERPVYPSPDGGVCARPAPGDAARLDCREGLGAAAHVAGAFGLMAAGVALERILEGALAVDKPAESE